jgi:hypothetical protein
MPCNLQVTENRPDAGSSFAPSSLFGIALLSPVGERAARPERVPPGAGPVVQVRALRGLRTNSAVGACVASAGVTNGGKLPKMARFLTRKDRSRCISQRFNCNQSILQALHNHRLAGCARKSVDFGLKRLLTFLVPQFSLRPLYLFSRGNSRNRHGPYSQTSRRFTARRNPDCDDVSPALRHL